LPTLSSSGDYTPVQLTPSPFPASSSPSPSPTQLRLRLNPLATPAFNGPAARGPFDWNSRPRSVSWQLAGPFAAPGPLEDSARPFLARKVAVRSSPGARAALPGREEWKAELRTERVGRGAGTAGWAQNGWELGAGVPAHLRKNGAHPLGWLWEGGEQAVRRDVQAAAVCNLSISYHLVAYLGPGQGLRPAETFTSPAIHFGDPRQSADLYSSSPVLYPRPEPEAGPPFLFHAGPTRCAGPASGVGSSRRGGASVAQRDGWEDPPPAFHEVLEDRRRLGEPADLETARVEENVPPS